MKTPMQELIEELKELQETQFPYTLHDAIEFAECMLDKEKEVIMDAYEAGSHTEWDGDPNWMLVEKREYYNETFNTKER